MENIMKCDECGEEFSSNKDAAQHFHATHTLSRNPLIFIITLSDGCTPGRWEAAQEFVAEIKMLREKYPSRKFQYIPFDHSDGAVNSLLVIEQ
jgi:hypothetical protein